MCFFCHHRFSPQSLGIEFAPSAAPVLHAAPVSAVQKYDDVAQSGTRAWYIPIKSGLARRRSRAVTSLPRLICGAVSNWTFLVRCIQDPRLGGCQLLMSEQRLPGKREMACLAKLGSAQNLIFCEFSIRAAEVCNYRAAWCCRTARRRGRLRVLSSNGIVLL